MKIFLSVLFLLVVSSTHAQHVGMLQKDDRCASSPCDNTTTGEDPQEQRLREGAGMTDAIRAGNDDQQRWSSIRLYSDSTKPERLKLTVVKSAGLKMRLDPKLGYLTFSTPALRQTFVIASPLGDKTSVCPDYAIQIVEASAVHALVRMACLQTEYAPGRYHMGIDYYLYDAGVGVMRNIWRAAVRDKSAHMPDAKPTPSLKAIPHGYRFDWTGVQPSSGKPSTTTFHNSFTRTNGKNGEKELVCTNLSAPKGQGVEDDMCEGGILPRVPNK